MTATATVWRLRRGLRLRRRALGGEVALLDEATGATHLVAPAAAAILELLAGGAPLDTAAIAARLAPEDRCPVLREAAVHDALRALRRLDLVEEAGA
ncbi:HPr-rel-A system PqqD family peptide chaperone [Inmirania thermothiophila]|uniref:PqqD family protein of HPr-rel-A system n=1 Tax=Inmirania thermothiophila TaxID=1750597 RepID=A0A3N1XXJ6_9GAMM|nr:HPr-rel-A system PqqD family peptide chaperone [Inmirania thermothiophila]ROR29647.1 PqqD family protein of HPr-rel-A system [Inmirania thermothiophila]